MLAQTVMSVVIALNESISLGAQKGDGGELDLKGHSSHKVPQRRIVPNRYG